MAVGLGQPPQYAPDGYPQPLYRLYLINGQPSVPAIDQPPLGSVNNPQIGIDPQIMRTQAGLEELEDEMAENLSRFGVPLRRPPPPPPPQLYSTSDEVTSWAPCLQAHYDALKQEPIRQLLPLTRQERAERQAIDERYSLYHTDKP
jgi:hypothetical protein